MELDVNVHLKYQLSGPTDLLLQIEIADLADQKLQSSKMDTSDVDHIARVTAEEGLGERIWIRTDGEFRCDYTARVIVDRPVLDISALRAVPRTFCRVTPFATLCRPDIARQTSFSPALQQSSEAAGAEPGSPQCGTGSIKPSATCPVQATLKRRPSIPLFNARAYAATMPMS